MTSALYDGTVVHQRLRPTRHRLHYKLFWMLFDLDAMPTVRLFSHNHFNLISFYDRDHLAGAGPGLRQQIEQTMVSAGLVPDGGPIRLLCMPRVLGHAFNPISVFFCHRKDESLAAILYEVNNTFGERHSYFIPVEATAGPTIRQSCDKAFYVSPFMRMALRYDFRVVPPADRAVVVVNAHDTEGMVIATSFVGRRQPVTATALFAMLAQHGLLSLKVIGAIHWEALRLWLKGLRIQPRPAPPAHAVTIVGSRNATVISPQQG